MTWREFLTALLDLLSGWPMGEPHIDERRQYDPRHNPGFDPKAREKTARQHGLSL